MIKIIIRVPKKREKEEVEVIMQPARMTKNRLNQINKEIKF